MGRFCGVDPLAASFANESPYVYAGNNPVSNNDPTGLYDNNTSYASGYSRYRAMKSNFGGNSESDYYEMAGWSPGDNAFNTVGGGGGTGYGNHWTNRYRSFEGNVALMSSRQAYEYYGNNMTEGAKFEMANNVRGVERKSVNSFYAEIAKSNGERLFNYFDGRHFQITNGRVVIPGTNTPLFGFVEPEKNNGATVYVENDGIGHVYLEVNGTVFSYGRYDGSFSPSSGAFGPVGNGVLLKKASSFAKERMAKSPTSRSVAIALRLDKGVAFAMRSSKYRKALLGVS